MIAPPSKGERVKKITNSDRALLSVIKSRLKQARIMNGISVSDAATSLGFKSISALSKIESVNERHGSKVIDHFFLMKAADYYDVTLDYFYGRTDDWEYTGIIRNAESTSMSFIEQAWQKARLRDIGALNTHYQRVKFIAIVGGDLANNAINAWFKWQELKQRLDLAGEAYVVDQHIDACKELATKFRHGLEKHKLHKKSELDQVSLGLIGESEEVKS